MTFWNQTVTDIRQQSATLIRRRYGVIEMADGKLARICLRPWPKLMAWPLALFGDAAPHSRAGGNRCRLYYNQPRSSPNFLALKYIVSTRGCTLETFRGSLLVLDEIARLKRSWGIVCHVASSRISDRLLARWGWEQHLTDRSQRHFIKRFDDDLQGLECPLSDAELDRRSQETEEYTTAEVLAYLKGLA